MTLLVADALFHCLFPRECTETVLEGRIRAFAFTVVCRTESVTRMLGTPSRRIIAESIAHYNVVRLQSAISHVTPADKLAGRELGAARERRRATRETSPSSDLDGRLIAPTVWRSYDE